MEEESFGTKPVDKKYHTPVWAAFAQVPGRIQRKRKPQAAMQ
ncbi:MAG TPA: hypothetical protein VE954_18900 [Oligoflexus sp.]|nr:hypothetical protein [Oligoflexus sp.]HYX35170.1 hypothetical protein [Oligoflexus sp.]